MTPRLYYYPGNASLAPHLLLEEIGCEFELVLVDRKRQEQKSAEYLRLNPNGLIPTLLDGELVLFEAAAICLHLADRNPAARLAPPVGSSGRSELYKWLFFLSNGVQPAYMAFRDPERHVAPASDGSEAAAESVRQVRAAAAERAARAFEVIEAAFGAGPFLLGAEYSACDAYLFMLAWWARALPRSPGRLPRVRACVEAVAERPATRRACRSEGIEVSFEPG